MFGGTPSNLAISVMQNREVEVIAGVNLPMLVKLARVRGDLEIKAAVNDGRRGRAQIHQRRQRRRLAVKPIPATCRAWIPRQMPAGRWRSK